LYRFLFFAPLAIDWPHLSAEIHLARRRFRPSFESSREVRIFFWSGTVPWPNSLLFYSRQVKCITGAPASLALLFFAFLSARHLYVTTFALPSVRSVFPIMASGCKLDAVSRRSVQGIVRFFFPVAERLMVVSALSVLDPGTAGGDTCFLRSKVISDIQISYFVPPALDPPF